MVCLVSNSIVKKDINLVVNSSIIDWELLRGKKVFITGATGGIGSFLVRCLLQARYQYNLDLQVIAVVRNIERARELYSSVSSRRGLKFFVADVTEEIVYDGDIDFVIHCANNTSSRSFVEQPVETMGIAINGTKNILDLAIEKSVKSLVFLSSMEVYGFIDDKDKLLGENDLGTIDLLDARSSYPMGKRAAETLCYSAFKEYGLPVKIARLAQVIGANVDYNDTRVYAYFARNIVEKKDIVLKTTGETIRTYCYITDVAIGLLVLLLKGKNGEVYNVANKNAIIKICDMAKGLVSKYQNSKLVFDIKETTEFFKETIWALDSSKLEALGWLSEVSLDEMYEKLVSSFFYQKYNIESRLTSCLEISGKKIKRKKYTFVEQIFSIKNKGQYKFVRLLGVDIVKVKRSLFFQSLMDLPIDNNKIVFANFNGRGYGCNPKYITEEIIKRKLSYDICWLVKKEEINEDDFPKEVRLVDWSSKQALIELSTAKVWVDNQRKIPHIKKGLSKKDGQRYLQTWHGSLGIKKLDSDVPAFVIDANKVWINNAKIDSNMMDYLLTNSEFENSILPHALWFENQVLEFGHPRNDIFFYLAERKDQIRYRVLKSLQINSARKTVLYVPSFRDDGRLNCYMLDVKMLKFILEQKFGGTWTVLLRLHPRVAKLSSVLFDYEKDIVDASGYPDIQELLMVSDVVISDYSSCLFDFILTGKPAFIFASDIDEYKDARGFYYPLESTPFLIAKSNDELCQNIMAFDFDKYSQSLEQFLREKGCFEDGHAAERVVDMFEQVMGGGRKC